MNPHYGSFGAGQDRGSALVRGPYVDRTWSQDWREQRLLASRPGVRPPANPELWLAWAMGEPTPGPRWQSILGAELRERVTERRAANVPMALPTVSVGPWRGEGEYLFRTLGDRVVARVEADWRVCSGRGAGRVCGYRWRVYAELLPRPVRRDEGVARRMVGARAAAEWALRCGGAE